MPIDEYDGAHTAVSDKIIDVFANDDVASMTTGLSEEDRHGVEDTAARLRAGLRILDARVVTMIAGRVFSLTDSNPYRPLVYLVRVWR
ncbi:hypothetical protein EBZ80_01905 [bacterium]|nr:hypothetical protein [bacterium]